MASFDLNALGNSLQEASKKFIGTGVSFAGRSLKLNTAEDAKEVIEAIEQCEKLEYLDLEGNTLGPQAAEAIAQVLKKKGKHLKRALWKDMFTGRMKNEIPVALEHLGKALCSAGTQLIELDLSDNAFGPIGVKGLASLLSSSSCYTLEALRLNNNGLGITGGKLLAQALLDCHNNNLKENSKPLALKVFIAGRNRLENEGAQALAKVFQELRTLEEVVMPQNGIYHVGVSALAMGLSSNLGLRILNLNDNTVGPRGAKALAKALSNFSLLETLNLGDCLLKTQGAICLANALGIKGNHPALLEVNLGFNEIRSGAVASIAAFTADKQYLTSLFLDGNALGSAGREQLMSLLTDLDKAEALETLDEDESDEEEEEDDGNEDESSGSENPENESDVSATEQTLQNNLTNTKSHPSKKVITLNEFLKASTGENLLILEDKELQHFISAAQSISAENSTTYIEEFVRIIMKVSALSDSGYMEIRKESERISDILYQNLFEYALQYKQLASLNNSLLVNLGLIKGENKRKIDWNLEGCFKALAKICVKEYFLPQTRETLKLFIEKPMKQTRTKIVDPFQEAKESLKAVLNQVRST